jgi:tRNA A-37 threonylcarbamoyl transferase component Bud32
MNATVDRIGSTIAEKYRLDTIIDSGGMGTVFVATHLDLGKKVAVKLLHRDKSSDDNYVARFMNEAKGTSRLNHRNIVDIIDVGIDTLGLPYFVMEYLVGESLKDRLSRGSLRLSLEETARIMGQVLEGLRVAHTRGVIHRDLKPGNIFIAKEEGGGEVVKILDFGLAKFKELEQEGFAVRTAEGTVVGTPEYMSPDQIIGSREELDHRTDIYTCGVILYRCVTGISPFKRKTQKDSILSVLQEEIPPPSAVMTGIPRAVDRVIMKAMARDKTQRFEDCASFIEAMKAFEKAEEAEPVPAAAPPDRPEDKKSGRGLGLKVLVASLVAALLAVGAWYVYSTMAGKGELPDEGTGGAGQVAPDDGVPSDDTVALEFLGLPEGAQVLVDGKAMSDNPVRLPRSDKPVFVVIRHEGREILARKLIPNANEKITIVESAEPSQAPVKPKSGKSKKKKGKTTDDIPF